MAPLMTFFLYLVLHFHDLGRSKECRSPQHFHHQTWGRRTSPSCLQTTWLIQGQLRGKNNQKNRSKAGHVGWTNLLHQNTQQKDQSLWLSSRPYCITARPEPRLKDHSCFPPKTYSFGKRLLREKQTRGFGHRLGIPVYRPDHDQKQLMVMVPKGLTDICCRLLLVIGHPLITDSWPIRAQFSCSNHVLHTEVSP